MPLRVCIFARESLLHWAGYYVSAFRKECDVRVIGPPTTACITAGLAATSMARITRTGRRTGRALLRGGADRPTSDPLVTGALHPVVADTTLTS